jgi:murein DD-endopeptidase MepM/ murein hydrolase activator NlpD
MKLPSAAFALTLVLLPTSIPHWLDTAPVLRGEPLSVLRGTVSRATTLAATLSGRLSPAGVHALVDAARPAYDLAHLVVGQPYGLATTLTGELRAFTYRIDHVRTLRVSREGEALRAVVLTREYDARVSVVAGTIDSSLFASVTDSGEEDQLALDLADIFAWDVDFNTEIQRGDSYRLAVEKLYVEGAFARYGKILAAEFTRGGRRLEAVRFDGERSSGYYTAEGTPLRKAFLRSPLKFSRISSGFSRARFHPILNVTRPHYGVDYAAPVGTPVLASANGVVVSAGWLGGYGKAVRLHHPNGYESLYGHLSRIDVRAGQRVEQGARIGAVGMTGLATGPHLDYRMTRNGEFVDPLRIQSPPAEPVAAEDRAAFDAARTERFALIDAEGSPRVASR